MKLTDDTATSTTTNSVPPTGYNISTANTASNTDNCNSDL